MSRWQQLKRNTRGGDRIRIGLLALLFVVLGGVAVARPEGRPVFLALLAGFCLPWPAHNLLVKYCDAVFPALRVAAIILVVLGLGKDFVRPLIPDGQEMKFALGLFAVLGLYTGTYTCLLSDERIEITG